LQTLSAWPLVPAIPSSGPLSLVSTRTKLTSEVFVFQPAPKTARKKKTKPRGSNKSSSKSDGKRAAQFKAKSEGKEEKAFRLAKPQWKSAVKQEEKVVHLPESHAHSFFKIQLKDSVASAPRSEDHFGWDAMQDIDKVRQRFGLQWPIDRFSGF